MEPHILSTCQQALVAIVVVSAPAAIAALVVGLGVSIFQATTQIQDQTLSYIPKMVAVVAALAVLGHWMLAQLVNFATLMFESLPEAGSW